MKKGGAETNRGPVHEHELPRDHHRTFRAKGLAHLERLLAAIGARSDAVGDRAHAVVEQGPVNEARPKVQGVHEAGTELLEPPAAVGLDLALPVVRCEGPIEPHDPVDEPGREDPDAAEIQEVQLLGVLGEEVVSKVRVTVDDAQGRHGRPPGLEQKGGDAVARLKGGLLERQKAAALPPLHGEEPRRRELGLRRRHGDVVPTLEEASVERHHPRLAPVVELLSQAVRDLLQGLTGVDGHVHAPEHRQERPQLPDVALHRALHLGILQLDRERASVTSLRPVHLSKGGRMSGVQVEAPEARHPVGPKLRSHAAANKGAAHGRGVRLQLTEFGRKFRGQQVRHRGEHLRRLHQGALEAAKGRLQGPGVAQGFLLAAPQAVRPERRPGPGHVDADPGGPDDPPGQAVAFPVGGGVVHDHDVGARARLVSPPPAGRRGETGVRRAPSLKSALRRRRPSARGG